MLEERHVYAAYGIQAASCSWKVWGGALLNGQQIFIWGASGIDLPGTHSLGKWYRLKVQTMGNEISFYVDDKLVHEHKDNFNPSGGVLLWSFDAVAEFDNVVITGDEVPDVGPSGYAVEPGAKLSTAWGWLKGQ